MKEGFPQSEPYTRSLSNPEIIKVRSLLSKLVRRKSFSRIELFPWNTTESIVTELGKIHKLVEPVDSVLGKDPRLLKSGVFHDSFLNGLGVGKYIFGNVRSLEFTVQQLINEVSSVCYGVQDHQDSNDSISRYLINLGGYGLACVDQAEKLFEEIEDEASPDVITRLYAKAGFGLGLLIYHQASYQQDLADMEDSAREFLDASEDDYARAMSDLLQGNV